MKNFGKMKMQKKKMCTHAKRCHVNEVENDVLVAHHALYDSSWRALKFIRYADSPNADKLKSVQRSQQWPS